MELTAEQKTLSPAQIVAFRSPMYVKEQAAQFAQLTSGIRLNPAKAIVDVGGGCGYLAAQLQQDTGLPVRVLDMDQESLDTCRSMGVVEAVHGDALNPPIRGDEAVVCMNLILHHLIGTNEATTRVLQKKALSAWRGKSDYVFVNEYVYDSFGGYDIPGRIIYGITGSKALSALVRVITIPKFLRHLRANTLGLGVRFRSRRSWLRIFDECGYEVIGETPGWEERVPKPLRAMLLKSNRKDSFLLRAKA